MKKTRQRSSKIIFKIVKAFKIACRYLKIKGFRLYSSLTNLVFGYKSKSIDPERRIIKMPAPYTTLEKVREDMQPLLDKAAQKNNGIDGVSLVLNGRVLEQSRARGYGGEFDDTVGASLFRGHQEVLKSYLNQNSSLKKSHSVSSSEKQGFDDAWTIAAVNVGDVTYHLVFGGTFPETDEDMADIHSGVSTTYIKKLSKLITHYHNNLF
jgi:hypothetical protein